MLFSSELSISRLDLDYQFLIFYIKNFDIYSYLCRISKCGLWIQVILLFHLCSDFPANWLFLSDYFF